MNDKIKIEKNKYSTAWESTRDFFITTDGREFVDIEDAETHQSRLDKKEKKRKEYEDFLATFKVERKPCSNKVIDILLEYDENVYNSDGLARQDTDFIFCPVGHNEFSCQWFNIKNQEDRNKIEEYYKLFYCYPYSFHLKSYSGWTLILLCENEGSVSTFVCSLDEYKEYIKDLTDSLPC